MFDSREYSWKEVKVYISGTYVVGIRAVMDNSESDDEHLYAAGDQPISIQSGNQKPSGEIKLLQSEVNKLEEAATAAGFNSPLEVRGFDIVCVYAPVGTQRLRTRTYKFVKFGSYSMKLDQGEKFMEVTIPFLCLGIEKS